MSDGERPRLIDWTGERCVPWADDVQVIYEHYHRYALVADLVAGRRVLDLACGEGYGAALLAATAAEVVGVDIDEPTVAHARAVYGSDRLRFEVASMTDPATLAGEAPFDVVVCFEAIEHVAEHDALMRLVRDRLAPDGVFVCSTPDVEVYTNDHGNDNPFHVRELTGDELRTLLSGSFRHVRLLRQSVAVGSVVHGDGPGAALHTITATSAADGSTQDWTVTGGAPHTYFVAVAADHPVEFPATAVLLDPDQTLVTASQRAARRHIDDLETALDAARAAHAEADGAADLMRQELAAARAEAAAAGAELAELRAATAAELDRVGAAAAESALEADRLRRKGNHDEARLDWLTSTNSRLATSVNQLSAENAELREAQSAIAQQLIDRYRSVIERRAPRGTRRRDAYERMFGRETGIPAPKSEVGPVTVDTSDEPVASIVIPTYGKWSYTRRCLESIQRHLPATPVEVIVVDDLSPDDAADRVAECAGVRLVRAERNGGFIAAVNLGAAQARGEYLVLLNNDTEVRAGWLDALVATAESDERIGLVGAKLVYPDGRLQECGGIVWADGTGWNYGRNGSPDDPEYAAVRDVDYCSAAALLVRRDLFERLGGLDPRYAPAYYEDTDLAFGVRSLGARAVVQPKAVVVHHEGVSNGTDESTGTKRFQTVNRATFVAKWQHDLVLHHSGMSLPGLWLARQRTAAGHGGGIVLVADHQVPRTDEDSGSVRMFRLLRLLAGLGERVVFFPMNGAVPAKYVEPMHQLGITVLADAGRQEEFLRTAGRHLSLAVLSRPQIAWHFLDLLRLHAPHCRVAYDTVDLHFLRLDRQARLAASVGDDVEAATLRGRVTAMRELELGLVRACDVTCVVSDVEQQLVREMVPDAEVVLLSNVHETRAGRAEPAGRAGVLFVGSFDHLPNRDAVTWLATEIMPLVWAKRPDAELHVVGSNPTAEIRALARDGVRVHGWVADLEDVYERARVSVAPLRYGAGVKGKVGESLSLGVPVVGTPLAVEGMHLADGVEVLVGADVAELAEQLLVALEDDELWGRLSEAGKRAIDRRFGTAAAREVLSGLLHLG